MKYLLFLSSFFLAINTFSQGNTGGRKKSSQVATSANTSKTRKKASGNEVAMEELHLNNPASSKQQARPEAPVSQKTKLDDLKDPFDSTKKIKGNQPATVQSSFHDRYANMETNYKQDNKQVQQSTASQNVEKTKLDDLKNPFDSTKKVKPGVQSGQVPASQKGKANRQ